MILLRIRGSIHYHHYRCNLIKINQQSNSGDIIYSSYLLAGHWKTTATVVLWRRQIRTIHCSRFLAIGPSENKIDIYEKGGIVSRAVHSIEIDVGAVK